MALARPLVYFFPFLRLASSVFAAHDYRYCDELALRPRAVRGSVASAGARVAYPIVLSAQAALRLVVAGIIGAVALAPERSSAEGLLDFFFGGGQKQPHQTSFFANIFNSNPQPTPPGPLVASAGPAFCVRSCDGKYFPLVGGAASPAQMCQAFCPASPTKVFFGSRIDSAYAASGERYADSETAFAYRKALRADCTCNGHNPGGLAPVDLTLDGSLHPGDILATADGLVAYSGIRVATTEPRISRRWRLFRAWRRKCAPA